MCHVLEGGLCKVAQTLRGDFEDLPVFKESGRNVIVAQEAILRCIMGQRKGFLVNEGRSHIIGHQSLVI